ncbi:hypothetical protein L2734_17825 [Parashewanella spongiae]|uniref:hypothetical protein n=1 Tax=Parashewanella spongiae TaxID=342950 RepID=UPI0010598477|nr:hypothetical protein [Parashewanella spongiae]MCL1079994.1 hypothetical protein [Parashewanella spongiae]
MINTPPQQLFFNPTPAQIIQPKPITLNYQTRVQYHGLLQSGEISEQNSRGLEVNEGQNDQLRKVEPKKPKIKRKILTFDERIKYFGLLQQGKITGQQLKDKGLSDSQIARLIKEEPKKPKPKSKTPTFEKRTEYHNGLKSGAVTEKHLINQGLTTCQITQLKRKEPKQPKPHKPHKPHNSFTLKERTEFHFQLQNEDVDLVKEKGLSRRQIAQLKKNEPRRPRQHKKHIPLSLATKKIYRIQLETGITTEEALKSEGISDWQIKTIRVC